MVKNSLFFLLLICSQVAIAQDDRYAIFLTDKEGTTFSIENPLDYLSQHSLDRRVRNSVTITEKDFPVNVGYVDQIRSLGAHILYTSRWMNAAIIQADKNELSDILLLPFVSSHEYLGPSTEVSGGRTRKVRNKKDSNLGIINQVQLGMLGLDDMHTESTVCYRRCCIGI